MDSRTLHQTLKQTFAYDSFRPLQREIIEAALDGRDVFALLPTGGGKSLCFQLPALLRPGLTVVVSPRIALMKDQVDQLQAAGVAATYLNSTLDADEARSRLRGLGRGGGFHRRGSPLAPRPPQRLEAKNGGQNQKGRERPPQVVEKRGWGRDV